VPFIIAADRLMQTPQRSTRVCKRPTFRNDRDTGTFGPGFDGTSGPLRKPCAGVEWRGRALPDLGVV